MTLPGLVVRRAPAKAPILRIDATRCGGKGACVRLAPALFELDRFGYAFVAVGAQHAIDTEPALRALAREAAVRCPDRAIRLERPPEAPHQPPRAQTGTATPPSAPTRRLLVDGDESLAAWLAGAPAAQIAAGDLHTEVERAGLLGQGGGRYPVAAKWRAVAGGTPIVVANGAEREPGTVKDRILLESRPHAVIDGVTRTAAAIRATRAVIAVDADHASLVARMRGAVAEQAAAGLLDDISIDVATVPARYVAGEETALLAALAGQPALPRLRPPHPTAAGLHHQPTVVHNIETLVQIALIARHGSGWFRSVGTAQQPGSGLFSVSVFGGTPRVLEVAYGTPIARALTAAGVDIDAAAGAVVGGWSGGIIRPDQFDTPLDHDALSSIGAALGTKAIAVLPLAACPTAVVQRIVAYFAAETAGQCPPCARGVPYIASMLRELASGTLNDPDLGDLDSFLTTLPGRGACAMPDGVVRIVRSLFTNFADLVDRHRRGSCAICQEVLT